LNLTHKILLKPNKSQEEFLSGCAGTNRFVWNWILDKFIKNEKGNLFDLNKLSAEFNQIKKEETPWIYEYPKDCNQRAFRDFQRTLTSVKNKVSRFPKFKSKHRAKQSFYISNTQFRIKNNRLELSKAVKIKMTELPRFEGKIMGLRVVKENNKWYACISFELDEYTKERVSDEEIGLDWGVKTFLTTSNNEKYTLPKKIKVIHKRIKRKQRKLSKSKKDSNNRIKRKFKLNQQYEKLKNQRKDFLHKVSSKICSENKTIKMEDLNIKGMVKNHNLARGIHENCFRMFRDIISYKSKVWNNELIFVDRFYPSSKLCSNCGNKKDDLTLNNRVYCCSVCSMKMDRDLNASINIKNFLPMANGEVKACGSLIRVG
jgi:putative transposase